MLSTLFQRTICSIVAEPYTVGCSNPPTTFLRPMVYKLPYHANRTCFTSWVIIPLGAVPVRPKTKRRFGYEGKHTTTAGSECTPHFGSPTCYRPAGCDTPDTDRQIWPCGLARPGG